MRQLQWQKMGAMAPQRRDFAPPELDFQISSQSISFGNPKGRSRPLPEPA